jgi:hypothetical protein
LHFFPLVSFFPFHKYVVKSGISISLAPYLNFIELGLCQLINNLMILWFWGRCWCNVEK